jgi:hypothetical protein
MSDTFRQAYAALTDFIDTHPEIEIGESVTSIPENVRPAFYALFNAARFAFVEEAFPESLSRAGHLSQKYCHIAEEVSPRLSFEDGPIVNKCKRYLDDPKVSLARELFDPLFDLLKKREDENSFHRKALVGIESVFPAVHRGGYERWVVLSLANMLEIRRAYGVPVRDLQPGDRAKSSNFAPTEEVPAPVESTQFFFNQSPKAIFAVPDFILQSGKLHKFIGFRSEFKEGLYNALNASSAREWGPISVDLLLLLEKGLTLVYSGEKPEDIALVGDVAKFCRPDLVLWCIDAHTLTREAALESMRRADMLVMPAKGIFIIVNEPWAESKKEEAQYSKAPVEDARIRILTAGFDRVRLAPVIEALSDKT